MQEAYKIDSVSWPKHKTSDRSINANRLLKLTTTRGCKFGFAQHITHHDILIIITARDSNYYYLQRIQFNVSANSSQHAFKDIGGVYAMSLQKAEM